MKKSGFLFTLVILMAGPHFALAQEVARSDDWSAHIAVNACFAQTGPVKTDGALPGRGTPFLSVTDHISEQLSDVITVSSGFTDATGSTATLVVDGKDSYDLLAFGGNAFVETSRERKLLSELLTGRNAVMTWTTPSGTKITDTYSLAGFPAMHDAAKQACKG